MAERIPQLQPDAGGAPQGRPPGYIQDYAGGSAAGGVALAQGGQAIAQGLDEASRTLTGVALQEHARHVQSLAMAAYTSLGDQSTRLLEDPTLDANGQPRGLIYRRGAAALGISDPAIQARDKIAQELRKTLKDPEAMQQFDVWNASHRQGFARQILVHEGDQLRAQDDLNYSSGIATTVSQAARMFSDPRAVDTQVKTGLDALAKRAMIEKWSPEQKLKAERDYRTAIADAVVRNAAATGNGTYSKALLEYFAPKMPNGAPDPAQFDGTKYDELAKLVRSASVQQESLGLAQKLRDQYPRDITAQVAEAAKSGKDAEVVNATTARLSQLNAIDDKGDQDKVAGLSYKFYRWWLASGPAGQRADPSTAPANIVSGLRDSNIRGGPEFYRQMELLHLQDKAQAYNITPTDAQSRAEAQLDVDMVSRPGHYASMSPEAFAYNWAGLLTPAQLAMAEKRHAAVIAQTNANGGVALPPKVEEAMVKLAFDARAIGTMDRKKLTADDERAIAYVRDTVREKERLWRGSEEGKKGDPPEAKMLEWINGALVKVRVVGTGIPLPPYGSPAFQTEGPLARIATTRDNTGKPLEVSDVKSIPVAYLPQIDAEIKAAGRSPNDALRLNLYNKFLQKKAAQAAQPPALTGGGAP